MPLLFLTIFQSILGLSILFPILGPLGRELGLSETQVGALSTSYALMQLVMAAFWGKKSETAGRKKILLVGVAGFVVGFALLGAAAELGRAQVLSSWPLFGTLVAARLIGGTFSSAMLPTAQAYAADLTTRENRTAGMAVIGAAFGLAIVFGPAIGGLTAHLFGLTAPIWLSTILGVLNAILVLFRLPEPRREEAQRARAAVLLREVARRSAPLLAVAVATTGASVLMEQTVAFLVEDRLHLRHEETPVWMGGALFVYGVVAVVAQGVLVRRVPIPPQTLIRIGMPITIAGLCALMLASGYPMIVLGMALQGLGQGLVLPGVSASMSLAVDEREQGAVAGLHNSAQGIGRLIGPLCGTALYELRAEAPYATSAGLLAIVLVFVIASPAMRAIARRAREQSAELSPAASDRRTEMPAEDLEMPAASGASRPAPSSDGDPRS